VKSTIVFSKILVAMPKGIVAFAGTGMKYDKSLRMTLYAMYSP
jgi:hypothetical protein